MAFRRHLAPWQGSFRRWPVAEIWAARDARDAMWREVKKTDCGGCRAQGSVWRVAEWVEGGGWRVEDAG